MEHEFTPVIRDILSRHFGAHANDILAVSELLEYLNIKTRSVSRGSKSRGSFANHYAVYVLVEDYINQGFGDRSGYSDYEGAIFTDLFRRQRELPFGAKLQNHALNHRLNEEFHKFFPACDYLPIIRNVETSRYWFNENLLRVRVSDAEFNIAQAVLDVIDAYIEAKKDAFERFIEACSQIQKLNGDSPDEVLGFVGDLLRPEVDARIFEIVSYAILKEHYAGQVIFWGFTEDEVSEDRLVLYKTGRTNANDGGIDFVMRPLGRFFQVTETTDVRKYFLDIDKVQRYPITFVVKSNDALERIRGKIRTQAEAVYGVAAIVERYMAGVEEIVNIPVLISTLEAVSRQGRLKAVFDEIVVQSEVEFNYLSTE